MTILNGMNGTSEVPEHAKRPRRSWCFDTVRTFRRRTAGFSGRLAFHPAEPPLIPRVVLPREYRFCFLREQFRAIPGGPVVEGPARIQRRWTRAPPAIPGESPVGDEYTPGHFADERAIGDPRDTVSRHPAPQLAGTRDETPRASG